MSSSRRRRFAEDKDSSTNQARQSSSSTTSSGTNSSTRTALSARCFSLATQLNAGGGGGSGLSTGGVVVGGRTSGTALVNKRLAAFDDDDDDDEHVEGQMPPAESTGPRGRHRATAVTSTIPAKPTSSSAARLSMPTAPPLAKGPPVVPKPPTTITSAPPVPTSVQPPIGSVGKRRSRWGVKAPDLLDTPAPPGLVTLPTPSGLLSQSDNRETSATSTSTTTTATTSRKRRFCESASEQQQPSGSATKSQDSNESTSTQQPQSRLTNQPNAASTIPPLPPAVNQPGTMEMAEAELQQLRDTMRARVIALKALERIAPEAHKNTGSGEPEELLEPNSDGTWEHAKRASEMEKTKQAAEAVTRANAGKHHMADFLPKEEHEVFMKQLIAARKGESLPSVSTAQSSEQYVDNKLSTENKGFQMLQKLGWAEGSGLGAQGQGITAPVGAGRSAGDTQGLGAAAEEQAPNDIYEAYRSRMMKAYKHRPNPLNNPRRPYY